jgi:hypothetical protein
VVMAAKRLRNTLLIVFTAETVAALAGSGDSRDNYHPIEYYQSGSSLQ